MRGTYSRYRVVAAWGRLDRYLLLNRPHLWTMRFHGTVALGLLATAAALAIAAMVPVAVDSVPSLRPFFLSLLALSTIGSLYWTWLQFRVLRHVSVRGRDGGGLTFVLYLVCLVAILLPPLAATSLLRARVTEMVPQAQYETDQRSFSEGVSVLEAFDRGRQTYRCHKGVDDWTPAKEFCPGPMKSPASIVPAGIVALERDRSEFSRIACGTCSDVNPRLERFASVFARYGEERTAANLSNLQVAHGLGAIETYPSRSHLFSVWFMAVLAATALTIARTCSLRLLLESAAALGAVWVALTFLSSAYAAHAGISSLLTVAVCAGALPVAALGLLTRPTGLQLRLLIAACLLAPAATLISGMAIATARDLLDHTDVVESMNQFATPWSSHDDGFFFGMIGLTTLVAIAALAMFRPVAQRMAAIPRRR